MLPLLQSEFVDKKKWLTEEEMIDFYAISQSTPGIIALNTATFLGYKQAGIKGAVLATLGVVTPSIIIMTLIASVLQNFVNNEYVKHAFAGVGVMVVALVMDSVVRLWKPAVIGYLGKTIFALSFLALITYGTSPVIIVIFSSLVGYIYRKRFLK